MSHVQKLIDGISDLNPMPRVASQILTLVEDPKPPWPAWRSSCCLTRPSPHRF
jgi:hypothetical protein